MSKIFRKKRNTPFVQIDKRPLQDDLLSWKAKGVLAYLLSLPDDWQIYINDLKNRSKDGRDSTANGVKELIKHGYVARIQLKNNNRFSENSYLVSDQKLSKEDIENWINSFGFPVNGKSVNGESVDGNSVDGNSVDGKPVTTNNINTNTSINNKVNSNTGSKGNFANSDSPSKIEFVGSPEFKDLSDIELQDHLNNLSDNNYSMGYSGVIEALKEEIENRSLEKEKSSAGAKSKKEKGFKPEAIDEVINIFNKLTGRKIGIKTESNRKFAAKALKYTKGNLEAIEGVFTMKVFEWKDDPKMSKFIEIDTFCRDSNFPGYLAKYFELQNDEVQKRLFIQNVRNNKSKLKKLTDVETSKFKREKTGLSF